MNFAHPYILYLLLIVPALFGLFVWSRARRRSKLQKFGRPDVLASLMPDASAYTPWIKISLELLALALLIIAFARPRYGEKEQQETTNGIEVMIALDVSRSMNASSTDDPNGISRLN
ncbi:MAG: BatA domain-containing protein, partial [Clostridiales bacterium]|nr:BatA domain-containing protein [Clostridiales bacterium]